MGKPPVNGTVISPPVSPDTKRIVSPSGDHLGVSPPTTELMDSSWSTVRLAPAEWGCAMADGNGVTPPKASAIVMKTE